MKASKALASAAIFPIMMEMASLTPAGAAPASAIQLKLQVGNESATVQTVDCRRYIHAHRRCVVWRGGICRRWVRYTHRCG